MQSDLAFIAGALGKDFLTYNLSNAVSDAKRKVSLPISDLPAIFRSFLQNWPEITLSGKNGEHNGNRCLSLGGGEIEITRINGCPVRLDGKTYALVLFFLPAERYRFTVRTGLFRKKKLTS